MLCKIIFLGYPTLRLAKIALAFFNNPRQRLHNNYLHACLVRSQRSNLVKREHLNSGIFVRQVNRIIRFDIILRLTTLICLVMSGITIKRFNR